MWPTVHFKATLTREAHAKKATQHYMFSHYNFLFLIQLNQKEILPDSHQLDQAFDFHKKARGIHDLID